jgi:hypothetical protein
MSLYVKVKREVREDDYLEGYEICLIPDGILVSKELYKILEIIQSQEDKISRIFDKAVKLSELDLVARRVDDFRKQPINLAKHSRRKPSSSRRRTTI